MSRLVGKIKRILFLCVACLRFVNMLKLKQLQCSHKFMSAIIPNFQKTLLMPECKSYFNSTCEKDNKCARSLKIVPLSSSIVVLNGFKTWSVLFNEETDTLEHNDDKKTTVDPSRDRTKVIPPETSIRYMKSESYKATYGDEPVWVKYRRNFKGQFTPKRTRKTCIRGGVITTGNPCPICRDEYLVLHYTNVELLKQFIHPKTGEIYDTRKIHVCEMKLLQLEVAIKKAKFYGYLTYQVPFRAYDYKEYYPQWKE